MVVDAIAHVAAWVDGNGSGPGQPCRNDGLLVGRPSGIERGLPAPGPADMKDSVVVDLGMGGQQAECVQRIGCVGSCVPRQLLGGACHPFFVARREAVHHEHSETGFIERLGPHIERRAVQPLAAVAEDSGWDFSRRALRHQQVAMDDNGRTKTPSN